MDKRRACNNYGFSSNWISSLSLTGKAAGILENFTHVDGFFKTMSFNFFA
jgi:hypothetical protein